METCSAADTATSNALQIDMTMLCLHNAERRARGLSQVRWNPALAEAALRHARDMVARHYFAHEAPGGASHMDRLAATGYAPSVGCWSAAENMGLSRGPSTPRQLWLAWMRSPAHRANIVDPRWQDFALGVVGSSPQGDATGLTVVSMFGVRSKHLCG